MQLMEGRWAERKEWASRKRMELVFAKMGVERGSNDTSRGELVEEFQLDVTVSKGEVVDRLVVQES